MQHTTALIEGAQLTYAANGVIIRLARTGQAFRVSTEYASTGAEITELTRGGYATIAQAAPFARHLAEQFKAGKRVPEVIDAVMADLANTPAAAPQSPLAQLAALGTKRQIAPTHAGAQLTATSDPQHTALAIARMCGRVYRGGKPGQVPVGVLKAAARKGFLTLTAKPGTRPQNWGYGVLTHPGQIELDRLNARDAAAAALADAIARIGGAA